MGKVIPAFVYTQRGSARDGCCSPDSLWSLWTDCCTAKEIVFRSNRIAVTRPSVKPIFIYCRSPTRAWYVRHRGLFFFTIIIIAPRSRSNFPNYLFHSDGVPRRKIVCSFFRLFIRDVGQHARLPKNGRPSWLCAVEVTRVRENRQVAVLCSGRIIIGRYIIYWCSTYVE